MEGACARYGSRQTDLAALRKLPPEAWRELGEEYLGRARRQVPEGRHFVDKLPANFAAIGFIKTMLPQARIIHLRRHPVSSRISPVPTPTATTCNGWGNTIFCIGN